MTNPTLTNAAALAGRLLLALIFVLGGWSKLTNYGGTAQYMASAGVPGLLLPLVILTELGGGLLVLFGLQTRLAAIALAGFCLISALIFHFQPDNVGQMTNFMKNVAIAGGFLALFANGPGAWSIDRRGRSA